MPCSSVKTIFAVAYEVSVKLLNGRQLPGEYSGSNIKRLKESMRQGGFNPEYPIEVAKVDGYLIIIDGHHRARAAGAAGISQVRVKFTEVSDQIGQMLLTQALEASNALGIPMKIAPK